MTKRILILSANPKGTSQLRLDEEVREIREGLRRSKVREQFSLESVGAVRYRDIHRTILDYDPHILHFSGHGAGEEGLVFEDETGQEKLVDAEALAGLFRLFANQLECVVLNACYSQVQAEAIAEYVLYVIGMSKAIKDKAANEFAVGFYDGLGAGKNYEYAYQLGCSLIRVAGIPQQSIPQLLKKEESLTTSPAKLPQNSPSYLKRPPIETNCNEAIIQPGALLRIKAPQKMGKTLLLEQVLNYARQQGYRTVKLDLRLAEKNILDDYQTFLQSLCLDVAESLELEDQLDNYWRDMYGLNKNCTRYWQKYLLPTINTPVVFALDNFERLFAYRELFDNFCRLLRGWYELASQGTKVGQIWQQLRLVVVHSTEVYPALDTNYSPFNVGVAVDLPEFSQEQVVTLAQNHKLNDELRDSGLEELMELVGGHPYLLQQAFSALSAQNLSKEQLLKLASTEEGIYRNHLHQQLQNLQQHSQLQVAYEKVVTASEPVPLDTEVGFKLHSLGLVKLSGNNYFPSCNLYRLYFSTRLG